MILVNILFIFIIYIFISALTAVPLSPGGPLGHTTSHFGGMIAAEGSRDDTFCK